MATPARTRHTAKPARIPDTGYPSSALPVDGRERGGGYVGLASLVATHRLAGDASHDLDGALRATRDLARNCN